MHHESVYSSLLGRSFFLIVHPLVVLYAPFGMEHYEDLLFKTAPVGMVHYEDLLLQSTSSPLVQNANLAMPSACTQSMRLGW